MRRCLQLIFLLMVIKPVHAQWIAIDSAAKQGKPTILIHKPRKKMVNSGRSGYCPATMRSKKAAILRLSHCMNLIVHLAKHD